MKGIKLISIYLIIFTAVVSGCFEDAPAETPAPDVNETAEPTVVPVTSTPTPVPTPARPAVEYKSYLDDVKGFYRVLDVTTKAPAPYDTPNKTLSIHAGDTVRWINDADERFTIVSEEGLWNSTDVGAILRWSGREFNYTFAEPGTYSVRIKEYPRLQHQKIVVSP